MPVLKEDPEIRSRLEAFGVTREELLTVVGAAVGARRSASAMAPASAGGQLAYIRGTEQLRVVFLPKGWELTRTDNIEAVYHAESGTKIIYQNADRAGDPVADPLAASKKGTGSARAVENGQGDLFPEMIAEGLRELNAASWYLFVYAHADDIRAELSFPKAIEDDQFAGFHERILLVQKDEWDTMDLSPDERPVPEIEVTVRRKK